MTWRILFSGDRFALRLRAAYRFTGQGQFFLVDGPWVAIGPRGPAVAVLVAPVPASFRP